MLVRWRRERERERERERGSACQLPLTSRNNALRQLLALLSYLHAVHLVLCLFTGDWGIQCKSDNVNRKGVLL